MAGLTVNDVPYDWGCTEIGMGSALTLEGAKGISYGSGFEVAKLRGTSRKPKTRTTGQYDADDGELTLLESTYRAMIAYLGKGYMRKEFPMTVSYSFEGEAIIVDQLKGCRIIKDAHDKQEGPDGLEVKVTLSIMEVWPSGIDPAATPS